MRLSTGVWLLFAVGCYANVVVAGPNLLFWDFENQIPLGDTSGSNAFSIHPAIAGTALQTGGGPSELFDRGDGFVHLTRMFGKEHPFVELTIGETIQLDGVVFEHLHNHNRRGTRPQYDVQLQLDSGDGFVDIGQPITLNAAGSGTTSTIGFNPIELIPGTYRMRWDPRNFNRDETDTNTDYFAINDLSLNGTVLSTPIVCSGSFCTSTNFWNTAAGGDWHEASSWSEAVPNGAGAEAIFLPGLPSDRANIDLSASVTLGSLIVAAPQMVSLDGAGTLNFATGDGSNPDLRIVGALTPVTVNMRVDWRDSELQVEVSPSNVLSFNNRFESDAGDIKFTGSGTTRIRGRNRSWNGRVHVVSGTTEVWTADGLGRGRGGDQDYTQIDSGGTVIYRGDLEVIGEKFRLNGGTLGGSGITGAGPKIQGGIELLADSRLRGGPNTNDHPGLLVIDSPIAGSGGLETSGWVALNVANSYSGATTVTDGVLVVRDPRALGTGERVTVQEGATLRLAVRDLANKDIELVGGQLHGDSNLPTSVGRIHVTDEATLRGRLYVNDEISGPGGIRVVGETRFFHDNSYLGVTRISGGESIVEATNALGDPDSPTILLRRGVLQLRTFVPEAFELEGGHLRLAAEGFERPIVSRGGDVSALDDAGDLRTPIVLQGGTTGISARKFVGGVTGTGDVEIHSASISDRPLDHEGNTTFHVTHSEYTIGIANGYTGSTTILGSGSSGSVYVQHPLAFGVSQDPVRIVEGGLFIESEFTRDLISEHGSVRIGKDANFSGDITFVGIPQFNRLSVDGVFDRKIDLQGYETGIGGGIFTGEIVGEGDLSFFRDDRFDRDSHLNSDNSYTGLTTVTRGRVEVNAPMGLGSPSLGTLVHNLGALAVNVTTSEPLSVLDGGVIEVNASLPRLPAFGGLLERRPVDATIQLKVPAEIGGYTPVVQGLLDVQADTTIDRLVLHASGNLRVGQGSELTVNQFKIRSGKLNVPGKLRVNGPLRKTSHGDAEFNDLGQFDGNIEVEKGSVIAVTNNSLGSPASSTRIASSNATLVITGRTMLDETIHLDNARGTSIRGGLHFEDIFGTNDPGVLKGRLDLGDVGSTIGIGRGRFEIASDIVGGSLTLTEPSSDSNGILNLTGNNISYTGETNLLAGTMVLSGDGRLTTSSHIRIGEEGRLALDYQSAGNRSDRIGDQIPMTFEGGFLSLFSGPSGSVSETIGALTFASGASRIEATSDFEVTSRLEYESLERQGEALAHFEVGTDQEIHFRDPPALTHGIIGAWATAMLQLDSSTRTIGFASYGPKGIEPLAVTVTDINGADATDNVYWFDSDQLQSDVTVNSLVLNRTTKELNGHTLTVESGGIIAALAKIQGGTITAGSGQELIFHDRPEIAATIADNASGPVNLTLVDGGVLNGANTYTGTTTIVGTPNRMPTADVTAGSFPDGGDLIIDSAQLRTRGDGEFVWNFGQFVLKGGSEVRFGKVSFSELQLESGEFAGTVQGDGVIRKLGPGSARLVGEHANFTGQLLVEEGQLAFHSQFQLPSTRIIGGSLFLDDSQDPQLSNIELGGGELHIGDISLRGTIDVTAPSTLRIEDESPRARQHGLAGSLVGESPLTIVGGGELDVRGPHPNYRGNITIEDTLVNMFANALLAAGQFRVVDDGQLFVALTQNAQPIPFTNPVVLDGGVLIASASDTDPGVISGAIDVVSPSFLVNRASFARIVLEGQVELFDQAALMLNGIGDVSFTGPIVVNGTATIDAQFRDSDSEQPGVVRFSGPIIAGTPESQLDLIAIGVGLDASFRVPEGRSLKVLINGEDVPLPVDSPGQIVDGNGAVDNDVDVEGGGQIQPGESIGRLTIDGNLSLGAGGIYEWEIADAIGDSPGWDELRVSGLLSVAADELNPFTVNVVGLNDQGEPGAIVGFDSGRSGTWDIAQATEVVGFDSERIQVSTDDFTQFNPVDEDSWWRLDQNGSGVLSLSYIVPSEIDRIVDPEERQRFVTETLRTWFGDSNFDGEFNSSDLVEVFRAGQYEDELVGNSSWATGDWDGDGDFTSGDLVVAFQDGGYERGPRPALAVPEPNGIGMMTIAFVLVAVSSSRRNGRRF